MKKIYAAPISATHYAVFVGDQKLTLPLSEPDAKKIADRYNGFQELEDENLRLTGEITVLQIQNGAAAKQIAILRQQISAFANSSKREKDLMAEKEELFNALKHIVIMARTTGGTAGRDDGLVRACEFAESVIKGFDSGFDPFANPADLDEI